MMDGLMRRIICVVLMALTLTACNRPTTPEEVKEDITPYVVVVEAPNGVECIVLYRRAGFGSGSAVSCDWGNR